MTIGSEIVSVFDMIDLSTAGDTRSVVEADGHRAINPSIGPSIGEMSVGLTNSLSASGSHLDRVGVIREDCTSDHDSASQQAIAGSCTNASLSGSLLAGPSGFHNRQVKPFVRVACSALGDLNVTSLSLILAKTNVREDRCGTGGKVTKTSYDRSGMWKALEDIGKQEDGKRESGLVKIIRTSSFQQRLKRGRPYISVGFN